MEKKCTISLDGTQNEVSYDITENVDCETPNSQVLTIKNFTTQLKNQLENCNVTNWKEKLLKVGNLALHEDSLLWNNKTWLNSTQIRRSFDQTLLATFENCTDIFYNVSAQVLESHGCNSDSIFPRLCSIERNMTIVGRIDNEKIQAAADTAKEIVNNPLVQKGAQTIADYIFGQNEQKKNKNVNIDLALQNVFWMVLAMLAMFVVCGCFTCALCGPNVKRYHGGDKITMRDECCPDMDKFDLIQPSDEKIPV